MLHYTLKSLLISGLLLSCVDNTIVESEIPDFNLYMEYDATNRPENALIVSSESQDFHFLISASNLDSEVALDAVHPIQERTQFSFEEEGDYGISVKVFLSDGTYYTSKELDWTYDTSLSMAPVVGFDEAATNDENLSLLVSSSNGDSAVELWIEGDLHPDENPEGSWIVIPHTNVIPVRISEGDGFKKFTVKTRNKALAESEELSLSVLRKEKGPDGCASFVANITKTRYMQFEVTGIDDRKLFYRVFGDIENDFEFHEFTGSEQVDLELTQGFGNKNLTIQIRDEAENYCLKDQYEILYDPDYADGIVELKGDPIWTDDLNVTLNASLDHLPSDVIEMYVFGDIENSEYTNLWIPYNDGDIPIVLDDSDGHKWVRVKFKKNDVELPMAWDGVYYNPFVSLRRSSGTLIVTTSNILGLESMTVRGCSETADSLTEILYQSVITCTETGSTVDVDYFLSDGTTITRSASVPD